MLRAIRHAKYLGFAIVALLLFPSFLPAHAVVYVPGVKTGDLAQYTVLHDSCQSTISSSCQPIGGDLNDSQYLALKVIAVVGPSVTLQLIAIYKNGTGSSQGATVDVDTGVSNITSLGGVSANLVVATGLQIHDHIWNSLSAPTFNDTKPEMVVGTMRTTNFLNTSSSFSIMGYGLSSKQGFVFDQESGLFVEISFSYTSTTPQGSTNQEFAIGMVDNNIWGTAVLPDFGLTAYPTTISIVGGPPGTTTITLTRSAGLSATVKLTTTPSSSSITCSLSPASLAMSGSDTTTLSCSGSAGTYTVSVEGNSGYSIRSTSVAVNIVDFQITSSGPISFQTGGSGIATITITGQNGYSSTTTLEVSTPTGLTCNLSNTIVDGHGSVTLTCSGQPGDYTVTVKATGGGTSHSTPMTVSVRSASASPQPASPLNVPLIAGGVVAALVVVIVALLLLRRRPRAPAMMSANPTQA